MESHESNKILPEILYHHYIASATGDTPSQKKCREDLHRCVEKLSFSECDTIFCAVNALCCEYEREAYLTGLRDGVQIFWELLR